ncbi:RNA polymerase sigma factor [Paenibacillus sp. SI8]|uniref:RNA polymerase sigma factor n=1 Tax=unclassified Paenibacillus TaxID=185978 RepID=UPI0034663A27
MKTNLLVKAAQKGDASAFTGLIEEHQGKLYRIAFAHFRNEQDARLSCAFAAVF